MNHIIEKIVSPQDLEKAYPLMKELRTDLSQKDFLDIYEKAKTESGYELVGIQQNSQWIALMGYRILHDYVHGKHLYIDDLVSTSTQRSKGLGAELLKYAEKLARERNCRGLRLCTGIDNEAGKKFYERENWNLRAVAYKKKIT